MHDTICLGDVKEAVQNIQQGFVIIGKQICEFLGIDLVARDIFLSETEQSRDIAFLVAGDFEQFTKREHLVPSSRPPSALAIFAERAIIATVNPTLLVPSGRASTSCTKRSTICALPEPIELTMLPMLLQTLKYQLPPR